MEYNNLREKTIFDFCQDQSIIAEIVLMSKNEYLEVLKEHPIENAFTLLELAEKIKDETLKKAVEKQYKSDLNKYFNE
jgi:hypothetical protein